LPEYAPRELRARAEYFQGLARIAII